MFVRLHTSPLQLDRGMALTCMFLRECGWSIVSCFLNMHVDGTNVDHPVVMY